jgi:hypothetical protein
MTSAEFIAACFWPLVVLFALLLMRTRDKVLLRYFAIAAALIGLLYVVLWFFYPQSSIVAVVDLYVLGGFLGLSTLGFGYKGWGRDKPGKPETPREWLAGFGIFFIGVFLVWQSVTTLYSDFAQPRLVLEGRVDSLRTAGRRRVDYLVDIAGRTVKATTPVYERLRLKPYVRIEIGRGSNYIYRIEYLAN